MTPPIMHSHLTEHAGAPPEKVGRPKMRRPAPRPRAQHGRRGPGSDRTSRKSSPDPDLIPSSAKHSH